MQDHTPCPISSQKTSEESDPKRIYDASYNEHRVGSTISSKIPLVSILPTSYYAIVVVEDEDVLDDVVEEELEVDVEVDELEDVLLEVDVVVLELNCVKSLFQTTVLPLLDV
jgi:hypothetical protein